MSNTEWLVYNGEISIFRVEEIKDLELQGKRGQPQSSCFVPWGEHGTFGETMAGCWVYTNLVRKHANAMNNDDQESNLCSDIFQHVPNPSIQDDCSC